MIGLSDNIKLALALAAALAVFWGGFALGGFVWKARLGAAQSAYAKSLSEAVASAGAARDEATRALTLRERELLARLDGLSAENSALLKEVDRGPLVIEKRIPVPAGCPEVSAPAVDWARFVGLYNAAAAGGPVRAAAGAGGGDPAIAGPAAAPD